MIEITLTDSPSQSFSIVLLGVTYDVVVNLNTRANEGAGIWSICFAVNGVDLINGIPLLGGVDILRQHNLPIKYMYMININDSLQDPNIADFGVGSRLIMLDEEEAAELAAI